MKQSREVATPFGTARLHLRTDTARRARALLLLGHGAGGGVGTVDLTAATEAALEANVLVGLVEQPYRVAGRRSPPGATRLDAAWMVVVEHIRAHELKSLPLLVGGRSMGARVACRTAAEADAIGVLCLAFPLQPPLRRGVRPPSRLAELDAVLAPTLVVQGATDPFGIPPPAPSRNVLKVPGDHGLKSDPTAVRAAVYGWLESTVLK
jgi:predicted alpha/beta-hydrolase family hydrolase